MDTLMDSYPCSRSTMRQLDMSIKEVVKEKGPLPFTWNLGMLMFSSSCSSEKIMARKNRERGTYSMPFGSLTCSWKELSPMGTGLYSAPMKLKDSLMYMVMNSTNSTINMNQKGREERLSRLKNCGKQ